MFSSALGYKVSNIPSNSVAVRLVTDDDEDRTASSEYFSFLLNSGECYLPTLYEAPFVWNGIFFDLILIT